MWRRQKPGKYSGPQKTPSSDGYAPEPLGAAGCQVPGALSGIMKQTRAGVPGAFLPY